MLEAAHDPGVDGEARNGRQALAQTRRLDPDVALMDARMSELDGTEAICHLAYPARSTRPATGDNQASQQ
jgi:DNA-binding NarL/FixJ family response regulator